jgi:predicted site-specific integrase-resolvase
MVKLKAVVEIEDAYDMEGAAKALNIGIATLWRWVDKGKIHCFRCQGRTLIPLKEVERLQNERAPRTKELSSADGGER